MPGDLRKTDSLGGHNRVGNPRGCLGCLGLGQGDLRYGYRICPSYPACGE